MNSPSESACWVLFTQSNCNAYTIKAAGSFVFPWRILSRILRWIFWRFSGRFSGGLFGGAFGGFSLGHDMGGVQNVWGEENVPENAPSRKILDPSKRASGLLSRGCLGKNRATTPEGGGKGTVRGGSKTLFWEGCQS